MSEIRFYLDENIDNSIAKALRGRSIDVLTTAEAGNSGQPDESQLTFAHSQRRVIVTQDEDLLILDSLKIPHSGIVYYKHRSRSLKEVIRGLLLIYEVLTMDEMVNHIEFYDVCIRGLRTLGDMTKAVKVVRYWKTPHS